MQLRTAASFLVSVWLALAPETALAQGPQPAGAAQVAPSDVVLLKNGGLVRGVVIASEPGRQVVIVVMGTGERRTIPWAEVERVEPGTASSPAPPPPVAPPAALPPALPPPPPLIPALPPPVQPATVPPPVGQGELRLHIEAEGARISLYGGPYSDSELRKIGSKALAPPLCSAPCDRAIETRGGARFILAGDDAPPSQPFSLVGMSGDVVMRVNTGSPGAYTAGTVSGVLGIAGALVGLGVVIAGAAAGDKGHDLVTGGGATAAASGGLLILGIVLIAGPGTTRFTFEAPR